MENLKIIVVGAGIGGLQAALALAHDGHTITVFESTNRFENVGAGIRVPPNSARLSRSWGVDFDSIKKETSLGNRFVDWKGNILLDVPLDDVDQRYGAPYYFIHRPDLVKLLVDTAKAKHNINIRTGCRVVSCDSVQPAVTLASGERCSADLVIAADGIKSAIRDYVNEASLQPQDTGDVAYRILVPAQPLLDDPDMAHLVREPWAVHWMGPQGHAVGYPLREGELYNIIVDVTHDSDVGEPLPDGEQIWKSARSNAELVERFKDWCPEVRKLCRMTGSYLKWKLADFDQLETWSKGKIVLLGDCCHPMMPYMAQGAAQATEDAAALAAALRAYSDLEQALKVYESVRKPRAAYIARNTRILQDWLHLHDGEARVERDRLMSSVDEDNPIFWGSEVRKDWLFGHDASSLCTVGIPRLPARPPAEASVYQRRSLE